MRYAMAGKTSRGILLRLRPSNHLTSGAGIAMLSAFPQEEEILYPPLTYLQVTKVNEQEQIPPNSGQLFVVVDAEPYIS